MLPLERLALSRSAVDRAAELRSDAEALERLWTDPTTKIFRVQRNQVSCDGERLRYDGAGLEGERYFLGIADCAYFAVRDDRESEEFKSLREVGHVLSDLEVGIATHAIALANWHAAHSHCPRCGSPTESTLGGSVRRCANDGSEHYPRTDPAVIVLIRDRQDRILLGRQAVWPPKRYSTFAGFVEPGESFESAVAREVKEEAGVDVTDVHYLGSQPWPFPASVMIAFVATTPNPSDAKADGTEIESVLWFTREELRRAVDAEEILLPPTISIARRMIEAWYGAELEGGQAWR